MFESNLLFKSIDQFFKDNVEFLNLEQDQEKWESFLAESDNTILFSTNDKIRGKVEFSGKMVFYRVIPHKWPLFGTRKFDWFAFEHGIKNHSTYFQHYIEDSPKPKYGMGEYWYPSCDNGKIFHENLKKFTIEFKKVKRLFQEEQVKKRDEEARLKEEERLEKLKVKQSNILAELDKDGNGELDVIEVNNDFDTLVKKHQSKITEVDRSYILNFVKISNYQKTKRKNLQSIFNSIVKTKNQQELNNQVSLLKDQIHSYELILFHSLNMVTSLIEDDMFTFYEIYESFDKLEMFNSNHENEVSKRLINIEGGINDLMNSIRQMENNIIGELGYLSYVTQESYSELSHNVNKQLASIDSSIKANNLLTGINAYQTYKLRQGK